MTWKSAHTHPFLPKNVPCIRKAERYGPPETHGTPSETPTATIDETSQESEFGVEKHEFWTVL